MSKPCIIIGAAKDSLDREFLLGSPFFSHGGEPYIYCADGGIRNAIGIGLRPDKLIGDMDSAGDLAELGGLESLAEDILLLPQEKDETDLFACVADALEKGFDEFLLLFCTNGRIDHFMAAAALLEYLAERGASGRILDDQNEIAFIAPGRHQVFRDERFSYLSIVPLDQVLAGITLSGVKYPLENATVGRMDMGLLISNEIIEPSASIETCEGRALLIRSRDLK